MHHSKDHTYAVGFLQLLILIVFPFFSAVWALLPALQEKVMNNFYTIQSTDLLMLTGQSMFLRKRNELKSAIDGCK
jgi:hypothetical protein